MPVRCSTEPWRVKLRRLARLFLFIQGCPKEISESLSTLRRSHAWSTGASRRAASLSAAQGFDVLIPIELPPGFSLRLDGDLDQSYTRSSAERVKPSHVSCSIEPCGVNSGVST